MSIPQDWVEAYAKQAKADLSSWLRLREDNESPECHRLQFLQMACEKLCKARQIDGGTPPGDVVRSHAHIANPLPMVMMMEIRRQGRDSRRMRGVMQYIRQLAGEIEILAPAVDRGGKRHDNCEYPWEDGTGKVCSPLQWTFAVSGLLARPEAHTFVELMQSSLDDLLS